MELKKLKKNTHFLLLGDDPKIIEKSTSYFAANKIFIINANADGKVDVESLKSKFEPRVEVTEKKIVQDSILDISRELMKLILIELLETNNDIFFNFSKPSENLALAAMICAQLAGIIGYKTVVNNDNGKIEKIEYLPALPFVEISDDQFALLSILVISSDFDSDFLVKLIKKNKKAKDIWKIIFPHLNDFTNEKIDKLIATIQECTLATDEGKFLNSLDDLVMIINPGIEKPGKKYNSERARLSYHVQKMKSYKLLESRKEKRQILMRASFQGLMFFMGKIIKSVNEISS